MSVEADQAQVCVRCPVLRIEPAQRRRLERIARNLRDHIEEAGINGWLGEVQELQISFDAAGRKLAVLDRLARGQPSAPVSPGVPIIPESADGLRKQHISRPPPAALPFVSTLR
ncbi:hypothetical protein HII36_37655 [Nonomuraea sp. NN258]|uniref:hypothetical protein n=1 Tax=Nonomuraea antri TaxID=2730852 RepID=UPI00156A20CD|nr:hypothetical protein [Nonomuraea antri]NRQ37517.1 hypothetical protein [Nonomuraea antri]